MIKCAIFDIDGTVADCSHRLHHIRRSPKNWKAFFDAMCADKPIQTTVELAYSLWKGGDYKVVFCTGRPDSHRQATADWLDSHLGPWALTCQLFMRKARDHRQDYEVKADCLAKMWSMGLDPVIAFEDRSQVVEMWRDKGLACFQVGPGDF